MAHSLSDHLIHSIFFQNAIRVIRHEEIHPSVAKCQSPMDARAGSRRGVRLFALSLVGPLPVQSDNTKVSTFPGHRCWLFPRSGWSLAQQRSV